jgi:hypothetical protein
MQTARRRTLAPRLVTPRPGPAPGHVRAAAHDLPAKHQPFVHVCRISNRVLKILESPLSCTKQTADLISNRGISVPLSAPFFVLLPSRPAHHPSLLTAGTPNFRATTEHVRHCRKSRCMRDF